MKQVMTRDASGTTEALPDLLAPWSPSVKGNGDIFYDGFEGPTYPWSVWSPAGTPTWAGTNYRAAAGSASAYCAGSTIAPPGPYANSMQAWMWTGPISLVGVTTATLEYQLYLVSEFEHDKLFVGVSLDDTNYYGTSWWGDSGGWMTDSVDLTNVPTLGNVCGQSTVYVAFVFESDLLTAYEGGYVDEVRITEGGAPPTTAITSLTPNHGVTGTSVDIAGANLGTSGTVRFGTTTASTSAWTASSITCTVPASLSPGSVNVTVTPAGGTASNALPFTVDEPSALKDVVWTINGQPLTVKYQGALTISGTLRDAGSQALISNHRGWLFWTWDASDINSWDVYTYVDSASGLFSTPVNGWIVRRTYFCWFSDEDSTYNAGLSDNLTIMAKARLSPPPIPKTVRRGVRVVAWGTLLPQHSDAANQQNHTKAQFCRYSNGRYRLVATLWAKAYRNTTSATQYKILVSSFGKTGRWRVRAIHQDADHAKTTSAWRYFRVT
jgi:hypothetical protein